MKRIAIMSLALVFAAFAGFCYAEEEITEEQIAALEASLFSDLETMDTSSSAKFAEQLEAGSGNDGTAKCWFRCRRRPVRFRYPAYQYYTWYCPVYFVPLRIVTYSVPVYRVAPAKPTAPGKPLTPAPAAPAAPEQDLTPVQEPVKQRVTSTVITTEQETVSSEATSILTKFAATSGRVSKGAVIDGEVPSNSPLRRMGLRSGDIITSVDGNPVNTIADIKRIKSNSRITYVRGDKIKVSGKLILEGNVANAPASNGSKSVAVSIDSIKSLQDSNISLYEYYDNLKNTAAAPAQDAANE